MNYSYIKIIVCLNILFIILSCNAENIPQSYDDCIFQKMPGATSELAAHEIKKACARKFNIVNELGEYSIKDIIVTVNNDNGYLVGTFTNNNESWIVTRVNLRILELRDLLSKGFTPLKDEETKNNFKILQGGLKQFTDYILDIRISPLETKSFRIKRTEQYTAFRGELTKAWGLKI